MKKENVHENLYMEVCPTKINLQDEDLKSAIQIIKNYTEFFKID